MANASDGRGLTTSRVTFPGGWRDEVEARLLSLQRLASAECAKPLADEDSEVVVVIVERKRGELSGSVRFCMLQSDMQEGVND